MRIDGGDPGSGRMQVRSQGPGPQPTSSTLSPRRPGKCRKDRRKRLGISAHENGIGRWRDDETHQAMLRRQPNHKVRSTETSGCPDCERNKPPL